MMLPTQLMMIRRMKRTKAVTRMLELKQGKAIRKWKKGFFCLNLTSEVSVWLNLIGQGHYGSNINIQDF